MRTSMSPMSRFRRGTLGGVLLGTLLVGCSAVEKERPWDPAEAVVAMTPEERDVLPWVRSTTVRFSFDQPSARLYAEAAGPDIAPVAGLGLQPRGEAGGMVRFVASPRGQAARFPARCRRETPSCPRAILEATDPQMLNPEGRPVRYGAVLRMTPADAGAGANVLQKGFSTGGGSQFKVQVDGVAGRPSCVLAFAGDIYKVESPVAVTDGRWHGVACTAIDGHLLINVDGVVRETSVPPGLRLHAEEPLRIGGKSVNVHNDQFAGEIDDVFVSIYHA